MKHGNIERRIIPSHPLNQSLQAPNETGTRVSGQHNGRTPNGEAYSNRSKSLHHGSLLRHLIQNAIKRSFRHLQHGMPDRFGRPQSS